jgi:hypothetical protein
LHLHNCLPFFLGVQLLEHQQRPVKGREHERNVEKEVPAGFFCLSFLTSARTLASEVTLILQGYCVHAANADVIASIA